MKYVLGGIFFVFSLSAMIPEQNTKMDADYLTRLKVRLNYEFTELNKCIRRQKNCDPRRKALYSTAALLAIYLTSMITKKAIAYFTYSQKPVVKEPIKSRMLAVEPGQEPLWLKKEIELREKEQQEKQRQQAQIRYEQEQARLKLVEEDIKKAESTYRLRENMAEQYRENKDFPVKMLKETEDIYNKADIEKNLDKKLHLLQQAIFKMENTIEEVLHEEYLYQDRQVAKRVERIRDPNYKRVVASQWETQEYSYSWAKRGGQDFKEKVKNMTQVIEDMRILAGQD